MMHHIRQAILNKLAHSQALRYSALKPSDLDGNVFGYHLKALISDTYITHEDDGAYSLTALGRDYIVHRYEDPLLQAHSIFLIVLRRGDTWLVRKRRVQPLLGMTGFVHGEPIAGQHIITTAQQRLHAKTGIHATLALHSSGLITITRDGVIASYSHTLVLMGETTDEMTITGDATGRNDWLSTSAMRAPAVLPSCPDIVARISTGDTAPFDLHYDIPS